jgi:hypothetical protein
LQIAHTFVCTSHDQTATVSQYFAVMEHGTYGGLDDGPDGTAGMGTPADFAVSEVEAVLGDVSGAEEEAVGNGSMRFL